MVRRHTRQRDRTPLLEFFVIIQPLDEEKRLIPLVHFSVEHKNSLILFSQLFTMFKQKYQPIYLKKSPDNDSILTELKLLTDTKSVAKLGENLLKPIWLRPGENEDFWEYRIHKQLLLNYLRFAH